MLVKWATGREVRAKPLRGGVRLLMEVFHYTWPTRQIIFRAILFSRVGTIFLSCGIFLSEIRRRLHIDAQPSSNFLQKLYRRSGTNRHHPKNCQPHENWFLE